MLILTRRPSESVMIGEDVTVTVLQVQGNQVRLGITAPKTTPVHREEIFERIKLEREALNVPPPAARVPEDPTQREDMLTWLGKL